MQMTAALPNAMPDYKTSYDITPHAGAKGFDDSSWPTLEPKNHCRTTLATSARFSASLAAFDGRLILTGSACGRSFIAI
jgi:hypothetical protein